MKIKLTLEYAGDRFCGWQRQPGLRTVQGELENALSVLLRSLGKRKGISIADGVAVTGSGRTDAGVSALAQVASFPWPAELEFDERRILASLNALTPRELVIHRAETADDSFDARLTPHIKCYRYRMLLRDYSAGYHLNRAWCVKYALDIPAMIKAARVLEGRHDFQSFRARDCTASSTIRTLMRSEVVRTGDEELDYVAHGKGFLKNMIRIIVGTLVDIGRGKKAGMEEVLSATNREAAGVTAPAEGLRLEWVRYLAAHPWEAAAVEEEECA